MPKKQTNPNERETIPTMQILEAWDLLNEDPRLGRFSMRDWRSIADAVTRTYSNDTYIRPSLGSVHFGVTRGLTITNGKVPVTELANQVILFKSIWMPDPVFSFFSEVAREGWRYLPDTGSKYFVDQVFPSHWRNVWDISPEQRRTAIRKYLPAVLSTYRALKPLVDMGVVKFFPWEKLVLNHHEEMRTAISELKKHPIVHILQTTFTSEQYSISPLVSGIEIRAGDPPPPGLRKGEPMWFSDSSPVLMTGILNNLLSFHTGASFMPTLPGDRILYDFIASGGLVRPTKQAVGSPVPLPQLSKALWPDIVAVRKDVEALAIFREIIADVASSEQMAIPEIQERLREAAEKINQDTSILKITGGSTVFVLINVLVAVSAIALMGGEGVHRRELFAGLSAFASEFLKRLYAGISGNYGTKLRRSELLISIADRLDTSPTS